MQRVSLNSIIDAQASIFNSDDNIRLREKTDRYVQSFIKKYAKNQEEENRLYARYCTNTGQDLKIAIQEL